MCRGDWMVRSGTRYFAAPEMYGSGECGGSTDVYSVGALMLIMLREHWIFKCLKESMAELHKSWKIV